MADAADRESRREADHETSLRTPRPGDLQRLQGRLAEVKRELVALRDRLQLVGQAAKIGLWEYDFEREVLHVSEELAGLYGLRPDEFTWDEFVSRLHPDDHLEELTRPTPSTPFGHPNEFFFRVRHRDGRYRSIRSRSVTHGRDDRPLRKLGVHIDITDDELLGQLNAKLTNNNERLRQFAELAGHDLRDPLADIRQLTASVLDDGDSELSAVARERLGEADRRAATLERLLGDLFTFATTDVETTVSRRVDPDRVVLDAVEAVEVGHHRVEVQRSGAGARWLLDEALDLCLRDLVDNACRHHDRDSGRVDVRVSDEGRWLEVAVADDGPGLTDDQRQWIFRPFTTADPARTSGLGLARVRELVDRGGGTLGVTSGPDRGATFTLRWPMDTVAPRRDPSAPIPFRRRRR